MTGTCQFVHQGFEKWCRDLVDVAADARASKTHGAGSSITALELIDSSWCSSSVYHASIPCQKFQPTALVVGDGTFYRDIGDSFQMIDEVCFSSTKNQEHNRVFQHVWTFSKFLEADLLPIAACHCRALLRWPSTLFPRKGF